MAVVWGDPGPASEIGAVRRYFLTTPSGQRYELDIPDDILEVAGGTGAVNGQIVSVGGPSGFATGSISLVKLLEVKRTPGRRTTLTGSQKWVILPCRFNLVMNEPMNQTELQTLFGNTPGQLDHYWREASYGQLDLDGTVVRNWLPLQNAKSTYVDALGFPDLDLLFTACVGAHDPFVDYTLFDGIAMMFNDTDIGCCSWAGSRSATLESVPGTWNVIWEPEYAYTSGTGSCLLSHQLGHSFGLPHSNNSDGDSIHADSPWDLMSEGCSQYSTVDGMFGPRSQHVVANHKDFLGWMGGKTLNVEATQTAQLDHTANQNPTFKQMATVPIENSNDYYTIEVRSMSLSPSQTSYYEEALPFTLGSTGGVLIHRVSPTRLEPAWLIDDADPPLDYSHTHEAIWEANETFTDTINDISVRIDSGPDSNGAFAITFLLDGDALYADYGPVTGLLIKTHDTWSQLHPQTTEGLITADLDGPDSEGESSDEVIIDFGPGPGLGLWALYNDTTWTQLNALSPESMAAINLNDLGSQSEAIFDYGVVAGVQVLYDNSTWAQVHPGDPVRMATGFLDFGGRGELVLDFGAGLGLWTLYNNATWTLLNTGNGPWVAEGMVLGDLDASPDGRDELIVDFGAMGIWALYNNDLLSPIDSSWTQLHVTNPEQIIVADLDGNATKELVVDFGAPFGIWALEDNSTWSQLHSLSPEEIVVGDLDESGKDDLVIDFGTGPLLGIWGLYDGTTWKNIDGNSPLRMATGDHDG